VAGHRPPSPDQLPLALEDPGADARPARLALMQPGDGPGPFDDDGWFFEPWWPGSPAIVRVEGGRLAVAIDHLADPLAAFPELAIIPTQLAAGRATLVGTLLALDGHGRPDRDLLRRRLRDPRAPVGTGAFVASDLLDLDGRPLTGWPFAQRRARLVEVLRDGDRCVVSRGLRGEGRTLADAVASMGLDAISARRLSARWRPGRAPDDYLRLPVLTPAAPETRPLLVLLRRLPLDVEA
jgi:bifunctional non-homologous end joining protein LigD